MARIGGGPFGDAAHARAEVPDLPFGHQPQPALDIGLEDGTHYTVAPLVAQPEILETVQRGEDRIRIPPWPLIKEDPAQFSQRECRIPVS